MRWRGSGVALNQYFIIFRYYTVGRIKLVVKIICYNGVWYQYIIIQCLIQWKMFEFSFTVKYSVFRETMYRIKYNNVEDNITSMKQHNIIL